jgi:hypothetical protein
MEETKADFGDDIHIVSAKFHTLKANVNFVLENWQTTMEAAKKGLECLNSVSSEDPEIVRSMRQTRRDLTNVRLRSEAKKTGKNAMNLRAAEQGKPVPGSGQSTQKSEAPMMQGNNTMN